MAFGREGFGLPDPGTVGYGPIGPLLNNMIYRSYRLSILVYNPPPTVPELFVREEKRGLCVTRLVGVSGVSSSSTKIRGLGVEGIRRRDWIFKVRENGGCDPQKPGHRVGVVSAIV